MSRLNLDVLCSVCSFLTDVPDVLAFSLTCSTLRPAAIQRRLGMRPVTITDGRSINSLYEFVFVDKPARSPHIHAIVIPQSAAPLLQGFPEELLRRLLAILSATTRVHTLSLYLPSRSSSSLLAHPLIVPAIARLSGIRELTLIASFERANALLRCIRSPIKAFRYASLHKDLSTLRNTPFMGLSAQLAAVHSRRPMLQEMDEKLVLEDVARHLGHTICELELPHAYLPKRVFSPRPPGPFFAVRSFTLQDVAELVQLDVLLHMLPNLNDTLVVEASPRFYNSIMARDRQRVETIREANRLAQEKHAWKKLNQVISTPLMLFALGLTCPLHHLTLDFTAASTSSQDLDVVLRDHTPTHLTISGLRLPAGLAHLDDLFSADGALARTTHLVVIAEYNSVDDGGKLLWPEDVLETLLTRIDHLGLTHVRIVTSGLISDADPFSASVHHGIRDLSFERLAAQLLDAVPSLSHIFFTSRGVLLENDKRLQEVWSVSKAWRVPSATPGPVSAVSVFGQDLQELSFGEAETVLDKEDMRTTEGTKKATYYA